MNIKERIKQIDVENIIFWVYLVIILLSFYANKLEKNYWITKNENSKIGYRNIQIVIFSIALLVYIYYANSSYQSLKEKPLSPHTQYLNKLAFTASSLVLISGVILLYIAYYDKDLNVELAFN